jgi:pectin methylesterase-like acyl-CoA thioesterase
MKFLFPAGIAINTLKFWKHFNADCMRAFAAAVLIAGMCQSAAAAATLLVNPGGASGCYLTIGAAVGRARMDYIHDGTIDTINVAPGIYLEDVIIRTPLSLVGAGRGQSTINAVGLPMASTSMVSTIPA